MRKRYGLRFLTIEHINFLKDPDTLHKWIGLSLKERCLMFHRHFGNHRINSTLLSKFYKKYKIKCKKIKFVKLINPEKEHEYERWRLELKEQIADLKQKHYRIIYLDESIFTTKTIRRKEYTPNRNPLRIEQSKIN